jgi:hypothetical protein
LLAGCCIVYLNKGGGYCILSDVVIVEYTNKKQINYGGLICLEKVFLRQKYYCRAKLGYALA